MIQIIKKISLDVSRPNVLKVIVAKQRDNRSRFLKVTFTNDSKKIEIPPSATAIINALRGDGMSKSFAGEVNSDGTATVPLSSWMLEAEGGLECDVSVVDKDGSRLTTSTFIVEVERASCDNGEISEDENYDILVKLIEDVKNIKVPTAYDLAQKHGFEGTEEEWLESLKGEVGKDGADGYTPQKGIDYFDGENGADGYSPLVDITPVDGGHLIEITDINGTKSFSVMDGKTDNGNGEAVEEFYHIAGMFNPTENTVLFIKSATFQELNEAIFNGKVPTLSLLFGTDYSAFLPVTGTHTDRIVFKGAIDVDGTYVSISVEVFSDDTNKVTLTENTGGLYYVLCSVDSNFTTFTADKTGDEIISAMEKGQTVIMWAETASYEIVTLPLTLASDDVLCFSGVIKIYNETYIASAEMPFNGTNKITLTKVPQSGEYATKSEIGNINAILDNINGAVI